MPERWEISSCCSILLFDCRISSSSCRSSEKRISCSLQRVYDWPASLNEHVDVGTFGHAAVVPQCSFWGLTQTWPGACRCRLLTPSCVKTSLSRGRSEFFFNWLPASSTYQHDWYPQRRNRDGNSTREFSV